MGPFYCPLDKKIYLDTTFFADMKPRYGGGGDFAYAYVISHEMGHHIQDLLGILSKVQKRAAERRQQGTGQRPFGAHRTDGRLPRRRLGGQRQPEMDSIEAGDIEKAVNTAQAIGDDRLQTGFARHVVPDSFTHGSSALRVQWLQRGLQSGQIDIPAIRLRARKFSVDRDETQPTKVPRISSAAPSRLTNSRKF